MILCGVILTQVKMRGKSQFCHVLRSCGIRYVLVYETIFYDKSYDIFYDIFIRFLFHLHSPKKILPGVIAALRQDLSSIPNRLRRWEFAFIPTE